jgi:hypothetical protein
LGVTPSSNRTTPDPNRKSYSSGLSVSSSTSYNSARQKSAPSYSWCLKRQTSLNCTTCDSGQAWFGSRKVGLSSKPAVPKSIFVPAPDAQAARRARELQRGRGIPRWSSLALRAAWASGAGTKIDFGTAGFEESPQKIPKAYESPKGELDTPVFPAPRKSSIPVDLGLLNITANPSVLP